MILCYIITEVENFSPIPWSPMVIQDLLPQCRSHLLGGHGNGIHVGPTRFNPFSIGATNPREKIERVFWVIRAMDSYMFFWDCPIDLNLRRRDLHLFWKVFVNPLSEIFAILASNIIWDEEDNQENPWKSRNNDVINIDIPIDSVSKISPRNIQIYLSPFWRSPTPFCLTSACLPQRTAATPEAM